MTENTLPSNDGGARTERRREPRTPIDSIVMPFLGSLASSQATFEYLLDNLSPSGGRILIPRWAVRREHLNPGDVVALHAPFRYQGRYFTRGRVVWVRWDASRESQLCGVSMAEAVQPYYPVFISLRAGAVGIDLHDFESGGRLLCLLLKDVHLLKRGVLIYLKHLVPFFYRVGEYPSAQYDDLKQTILEDIRRRVAENARVLADCEAAARKENWAVADLPRALDLARYRGAVESELQRDLLLTAFQTDAVLPYLDAIQDLENKLYYSFNTLMMLYMQALSEEALVPPPGVS